MNIQLWFVDCQKDFINATGKLSISNATDILGNLSKLRKAATKYGIKAVYTQDFHAMDDPELSDKPDFKTTFPPHCVAGTVGATFVDEVECPQNAVILNPQDDLMYILDKHDDLGFFERDAILTKQIFSTFDGNKNAETYVEATRPDVVFACGVAGDVCVKAVVEGFVKMNDLLIDLGDRPIKICLVTDAVKSLDEDNTTRFLMKMVIDRKEFSLVDANFVTKFLDVVDGFGETL